jgi:short subunit dehydrogenase-like uncharacterized protein
LLGATGYTGQRVLGNCSPGAKRTLVGRNRTLVGRNRTTMLALADRLAAELPAAEVDVTSTADLARLLEPTDVFVSTVGPFLQLDRATVTAVVRRVFELDSVAPPRSDPRARVRYDYVPCNLAGALA